MGLGEGKHGRGSLGDAGTYSQPLSTCWRCSAREQTALSSASLPGSSYLPDTQLDRPLVFAVEGGLTRWLPAPVVTKLRLPPSSSFLSSFLINLVRFKSTYDSFRRTKWHIPPLFTDDSFVVAKELSYGSNKGMPCSHKMEPGSSLWTDLKMISR